MQKLIKVLNELDGNIYFDGNSVIVTEQDEKGNYTSKHTIRRRPVAGNDGVETWKFVARKSNRVG